MWALKTYQVLIASKSIINKSKPGIELLIEYSMLASAKPLWQLAGKPKPREKLKKRLRVVNKAEHNDFVEIWALDKNFIVEQPRIKAESAHDP